MTYPLVIQLRFTRREFQRALEGLSEEDARKRILPMNCISWNVGHLAWQEQRYFLSFAQDGVILGPFGGSGTAGLLCRQHQRHYLLGHKRGKRSTCLEAHIWRHYEKR